MTKRTDEMDKVLAGLIDLATPDRTDDEKATLADAIDLLLFECKQAGLPLTLLQTKASLVMMQLDGHVSARRGEVTGELKYKLTPKGLACPI